MRTPSIVLHDQLRRAVVHLPAIEQTKAIFAHESREDLAFHTKATRRLAMEQPARHHLQRYTLLVVLIRTLGKIDGAHAAPPERSQHAVTPDDLPALHLNTDRRVGTSVVMASILPEPISIPS